MILVDTSVWVDHLRRRNSILAALLDRGEVLVHPFVIGEIACGSLTHRRLTLDLLQHLPASAVAEPDEALGFIELRGLHGKGIGAVDIHLLASTALTSGGRLWSRDKRLAAAAAALSLAYDESRH